MEGQQMMAIGHQPPQHQPVPQAHHQHQQPGQVPLMVSTAMQPTQQYLSTYTATAAAQVGSHCHGNSQQDLSTCAATITTAQVGSQCHGNSQQYLSTYTATENMGPPRR